MQSPYRLSHSSRSHGTIRALWRQGLFFYAPLTDLFGTPVSGTPCGALIYGQLALVDDRILRWQQDSGTITNDMRAYYEGGQAGLEISTSGNNSRSRLLRGDNLEPRRPDDRRGLGSHRRHDCRRSHRFKEPGKHPQLYARVG